ncbi:hypothetical protein KIPB_012096 [Kipferlia bialata]|uniref:Uncharacterized protein n=1 Tax=Kipferlia bialata TaxID=797122 RepID=A0A9K3GPA3_9EUKA|nr:hypothetical protein KIPB_012096 [Kipferlia bialata]|eukprot:g12096.t1
MVTLSDPNPRLEIIHSQVSAHYNQDFPDMPLLSVNGVDFNGSKWAVSRKKKSPVLLVSVSWDNWAQLEQAGVYAMIEEHYGDMVDGCVQRGGDAADVILTCDRYTRVAIQTHV